MNNPIPWSTLMDLAIKHDLFVEAHQPVGLASAHNTKVRKFIQAVCDEQYVYQPAIHESALVAPKPRTYKNTITFAQQGITIDLSKVKNFTFTMGEGA